MPFMRKAEDASKKKKKKKKRKKKKKKEKKKKPPFLPMDRGISEQNVTREAACILSLTEASNEKGFFRFISRKEDLRLVGSDHFF